MIRAATLSRTATFGLCLVLAAACTAKPKAQDVAAARACEAFMKVTQNATSTQLKTDAADKATKLLDGSAEAAATGKAAPKWAGLGSDVIAFLGDLTDGKVNTATGNQIADECGKIPTAAQIAGGFVRK